VANFNKFNSVVEYLWSGVFDLVGTGGSTADVCRVYLTNATPGATDTLKANVAEIATGNGYAGAIDINNVGSRSGGTFTLTGNSASVVADAGTIGPFQRVVVYDDTPTDPADPLLGWWDYGSALTLQDGESFAIRFNGAAVGEQGSILTLT
jgi:hypothetical protein